MVIFRCITLTNVCDIHVAKGHHQLVGVGVDDGYITIIEDLRVSDLLTFLESYDGNIFS